ncbi:MAG: hypothetical protein ACFB0A_02800 [Croceivirga sp.]
MFAGLFLSLFFMYFAQERLYNSLNNEGLTLGSERYLRILSVILIFVSSLFSLFLSKAKYHFSIYFCYLTLVIYVSLNYIFSGADPSNMTQFMSTKGIGPWICLGLIFVSYDTKRFESFKKFLFFSSIFISLLAIVKMVESGVGLWRGQALSQYRVYAVNLIWVAPYVFLMLKNKPKLRWLRLFSLIMGIVLALVIQTRSFLIIYLITILFDFFHTKNLQKYSIALIVGFIGFAYLVLNTCILNDSMERLLNRGTDDTRSCHLMAFFSQLKFTELITGKGFFASYSKGGYTSSYLDNQWLYLFWWGGLIPVLTYFYLSALLPIKLILRGKMDYETQVECFVLILWVLALGGLAIYSTMSVDFFFFIISILQGRVLFKYSLNSK